MEIKPPSGRPFFERARETTGADQQPAQRPWGGRHLDRKAESSSLESGFDHALKSVRSQYSRADLNDPAKLDIMIRSSVRELIDTEFAERFSLSEKQKAQIGDWMGDDPTVRRQIEKLLERTLA